MNPLLPAFALVLLTPEAAGDLAIETFDARYAACIEGVRSDPEAVRRRAERWRSEGGGAAALHCQALGDLAAGYAKLAAVRLEELAERSDAGDALVRARILSQAALAWLEADEVTNAQNAIDAAFAAAPAGGELFLTAGQVYVAAGKFQSAADAITEAETQGLKSARGYITRARAYQALGQPREAADDVVAALALDPFNADALVLRGELRQAGIEIEAYVEEVE